MVPALRSLRLADQDPQPTQLLDQPFLPLSHRQLGTEATLPISSNQVKDYTPTNSLLASTVPWVVLQATKLLDKGTRMAANTEATKLSEATTTMAIASVVDGAETMAIN